MKKATLIISALALVFSVNAQTKATFDNSKVIGSKPVVKSIPSSRALGDTLFFMDGYYIWGTGISTGFGTANDDVDGLTIFSGLQSGFGTTSAYRFFYSIHSVSGDSVFSASATSYFAAAGQADNWLAFGPIAIPAAGATLSWKHNIPDGSFRDGYKVHVSTTGLTNYTDFTAPAIFSVADNDPSTAGDTVNFPDDVYAPRSVNFSAYAGQSIYLAFQHYGFDQFILSIKDVFIAEGATSVEEFVNGVKFSQNSPNPFNGITAINYELENAANITLNVFDVTGKKVAEINEGNKTAGKHVVKFNSENISAGVYYYSLKVGNSNTITKKMVVVK